jgi:hypothetical protein
VRLAESATLGAITVGKYFAAANPLTSTVVHYIWAVDSGNPCTEGYYWSKWANSIDGFNAPFSTISNISGKRPYQNTGSFSVGEYSSCNGCTAYEGNTHNFYMRGGSVCNSCLGQDNYAYGSNVIPYAAYEGAGTGWKVTYNNSIAARTIMLGAPQGFSGFISHGSTGAFGTISYINCSILDTAPGITNSTTITSAQTSNVVVTGLISEGQTVGYNVDSSALLASDYNDFTQSPFLIYDGGNGNIVIGSNTYSSLGTYEGATLQDQHSTPQIYFVITDGGGSDLNNGLTVATAWATAARAEQQYLPGNQQVVSSTSGVWTLSYPGPYNPNNSIPYSDPLLANWPTLSTGITQGSINLTTDNSILLSNGVHFPAVKEADFAYSTINAITVQPLSQYTISAYCANDIPGVFNPLGGANAQAYFRFNNTTINSGIVTTRVGLTNLYRIYVTATTGATVTKTTGWGINRSAITVQQAGFICSGLQVNAGSTPTAYSPTP